MEELSRDVYDYTFNAELLKELYIPTDEVYSLKDGTVSKCDYLLEKGDEDYLLRFIFRRKDEYKANDTVYLNETVIRELFLDALLQGRGHTIKDTSLFKRMFYNVTHSNLAKDFNFINSEGFSSKGLGIILSESKQIIGFFESINYVHNSDEVAFAFQKRHIFKSSLMDSDDKRFLFYSTEEDKLLSYDGSKLLIYDEADEYDLKKFCRKISDVEEEQKRDLLLNAFINKNKKEKDKENTLNIFAKMDLF